jgi:hypothetical protein
MAKRKYMMQGLTRYRAKAIQKRVQQQSAWVSPCGLTIRKVADLCNRGYAISDETCRVPVKELWRYREFSWDPKKHFEPQGPNVGTWKTLKGWMQRTKWPDSHPLHFNINPQAGVYKVADGNHRLVMAKRLRMKTAPVVYRCRAGSGIYDMMRPDWGKTIQRPYMTEEQQTKSVTRQKRRNWKMIEGGYAKYNHRNVRASRKHINRMLHSKEYRHYVQTHGGDDRCSEMFRRIPKQQARLLKRIPKEQGAAATVWDRDVRDLYTNVMQCAQQRIDAVKKRAYADALPSGKSSPPAKRVPTDVERRLALMLKQTGL